MKIYYEKQTIQEILKESRKEKGMSQSELGKLLGVSHAAVSDLERGVTDVTLTYLEMWTKALGLKFEIGLKKLTT